MADVTFSSPISPAAFTSFTIDVSDMQGLNQLSEESALRLGFTVVGSGARAAHANLTAVETRSIINGGPLMTLGGTLVAASIGQGHLVKVDLDVYNTSEANNKEAVSITGVITNVTWTADRGFHGQRVDFVLSRCDRLHVRSGASVTTETAP